MPRNRYLSRVTTATIMILSSNAIICRLDSLCRVQKLGHGTRSTQRITPSLPSSRQTSPTRFRTWKLPFKILPWQPSMKLYQDRHLFPGSARLVVVWISKVTSNARFLNVSRLYHNMEDKEPCMRFLCRFIIVYGSSKKGFLVPKVH